MIEFILYLTVALLVEKWYALVEVKHLLPI